MGTQLDQGEFEVRMEQHLINIMHVLICTTIVFSVHIVIHNIPLSLARAVSNVTRGIEKSPTQNYMPSKSWGLQTSKLYWYEGIIKERN